MTVDGCRGRAGDGRPREPVRGDAYEALLRSSRYRAERSEKAAVILALCADRIRRAGRVADLGAGTGLIKKEIELNTDKYLIGFDIDRSFMEWKRGMVVADVLRLPVGPERFGFLLMNHLYEHVDDQAGLFREAFRILRPGGGVYVAAGNVLAVMEPHYRLPFLSWLPPSLASLYLRAAGRGRAYRDIRFRTYGTLTRMMEAAGFRVRDLTERVLSELLGPERGGRWLPVWRLVRRLPPGLRRPLLRGLSPQWFFLLEKPAEPGGRGGGPARPGAKGPDGQAAAAANGEGAEMP